MREGREGIVPWAVHRIDDHHVGEPVHNGLVRWITAALLWTVEKILKLLRSGSCAVLARAVEISHRSAEHRTRETSTSRAER